MKDIRVQDIEVGTRHRKDLGDIASLAKSIRDVGLLHPIVVTSTMGLIAGARRLAAVKELGWDTVPVYIVDLDNMLQAEHDENACRKNFSPSEAVAIGAALEWLERSKAKQRQRQHEGTAPGKKKDTSGKLPEVNGDTRDRVAEAVGMSGKTYEKAKAVVQAAEENPELAPMVEEMDKTGKVDPAYRKVKGKGPAKREPPAHPISDSVGAWLELVRQKLDGMRTQYGGFGKASKEKGWDKKKTSYIEQMLTALHLSFGEILEELLGPEAGEYNIKGQLYQQVKPLLDELEEIGRMHEFRMSPVAVRMVASKLRKIFEQAP